MSLSKPLLLSITFFCLLINISSAQYICRGHGLSDLYFSGPTGYYEYTLFRSDDNGATISVVCTYDFRNDSSFVSSLENPLAENSDGLVYCLDSHRIGTPLCKSNDYGTSWINLNTSPPASRSLTGGAEPGKLYIMTRGNDPSIFYSLDFGQTFQKVCPIESESIEVGTEPNELWALSGYYGTSEKYWFLHSNNNGNTFDTIPISESVLGNGYRFKQFSRGTQAGEIFLSTYNGNLVPGYDSTRLYRSLDYAHSFSLIYQELNEYNNSFRFTAGRSPCSLYLIRSKIELDTVKYWIEYSDDCGTTFITTGITELKTPENEPLNINPNPVFNQTDISYKVPEYGIVQINIYSLIANLKETIFNQLLMPGLYNQTFDLTNLSAGIYLVEMKVNGRSIAKTKIIKQ